MLEVCSMLSYDIGTKINGVNVKRQRGPLQQLTVILYHSYILLRDRTTTLTQVLYIRHHPISDKQTESFSIVKTYITHTMNDGWRESKTVVKGSASVERRIPSKVPYELFLPIVM